MELTDIDPEGRFHPSLVWVKCEESVQPGWMHIEGEFFAPEGAE